MPISNQTIAVIGANSMVGSRFCELTNCSKILKVDLNNEISVDLRSPLSIDNFYKKYDFDVAILFSAFTDVDMAEKQRNNKEESCWQINVVGSKHVIEASKKYGRKLIFISTDFVFDGQNGPYSEDDPIGGISEKVSWYGKSKIAAEENCELILKDYLILRISYPYRGKFAPKLDFAKQIIKKYDDGTLYPMFTDQIITPTFIDDVAPAIDLLLSKNLTGIYHLASPQTVTPYEFTKHLISTFEKNPDKIKKTSIFDYLKNPKLTPRPPKSGLKVEKITMEGITPTGWKKGIEEIYKQSKGQLI